MIQFDGSHFFSDGLVETTTNQECVVWSFFFKSIDDKFHFKTIQKNSFRLLFLMMDLYIPKKGSLDPQKWRHFDDQNTPAFQVHTLWLEGPSDP